MSIEDVERILDETQESTDYQRVKCLMFIKYTCTELSLIPVQHVCQKSAEV